MKMSLPGCRNTYPHISNSCWFHDELYMNFVVNTSWQFHGLIGGKVETFFFKSYIFVYCTYRKRKQISVHQTSYQSNMLCQKKKFKSLCVWKKIGYIQHALNGCRDTISIDVEVSCPTSHLKLEGIWNLIIGFAIKINKMEDFVYQFAFNQISVALMNQQKNFCKGTPSKFTNIDNSVVIMHKHVPIPVESGFIQWEFNERTLYKNA